MWHRGNSLEIRELFIYILQRVIFPSLVGLLSDLFFLAFLRGEAITLTEIFQFIVKSEVFEYIMHIPFTKTDLGKTFNSSPPFPLTDVSCSLANSFYFTPPSLTQQTASDQLFQPSLFISKLPNSLSTTPDTNSSVYFSKPYFPIHVDHCNPSLSYSLPVPRRSPSPLFASL